MQTNECYTCGSNDFTVTDGAFVCNECGIQSQVSLYNFMIHYFAHNQLKIKICLKKRIVLFYYWPQLLDYLAVQIQI